MPTDPTPAENSARGNAASLPPELVSIILDYIPEDMQWSSILHNCALVSSAWRQLSQARLFSTASLSTTAVCKAWNRKLDHYPDLALYVTTLSLWGGDADDEDGAISLFMESDDLKALLPRFPNVRTLVLEEFSIWGDSEQALVSQFHQVEKLHIDVRFSEPHQMLELASHMRNIRNLSIGDLGFCCWNITGLDKPFMDRMQEVGGLLEKWNPRGVAPIRLQKLKLTNLHNQTDILMWFSSPSFDLSDLQVLTFDWRAGTQQMDTNILTQFVSKAGRFVRHLYLYSDGIDTDLLPGMPFHTASLNFTDEKPNSEKLISSRLLNDFVSLETIAIADAPYSRDSWRQNLGLTFASKLLLTVPSTLKQVDIGMYIVFDREHTPGNLLQLPEWNSLDQLLTGSKFVGLQYLNLYVNLYIPPFVSEEQGLVIREAVTTSIERLLPRLSSRHMLKLNVKRCSCESKSRST
uniref:F-box domain-containing protein n=1 Tax=Moniliophthora roreri TaxID=221103 RepID=A0A0W0G9M3_MONRR